MSSTDPSVVPTRHWHPVGGGKIQCDVCPRACRLGEGQRGLCFVRANQGGRVVLTTWGRSSGFCVDPVEKKPLNHFLPGSPILSFGTAGCNLSCRFCQNWDISKSRRMDTLADSAPPRAVALAARRLGCSSVAFTYNDPVVFMEYAMDVADACHELGLRAVAVTAGYMRDKARREFYSHMDAANVDLKGFTRDFYFRTCAGELEPVLETLQYLKHGTRVWLELTNLVIPGLNDSGKETGGMVDWILRKLGPDTPLHFTAFHPDYKMTDRGATPAATLARARGLALRAGLRFVYCGNVRDPEGGTTFCPSCGAALIRRDGFTILDFRLDEKGRCLSCQTACPGVFEGPAGTWGSRRLPVRLQDFPES